MLKLIKENNNLIEKLNISDDEYEIKKERSYFSVYKNGKFLTNADSESEAEEEIELDKLNKKDSKDIKEEIDDNIIELKDNVTIEPQNSDFEDLDKEEKELLTRNAFYEQTNGIIQNCWNLISDANSLISTLDFNYEKDNKEDIKIILNEFIDDLAINIGMLNKINNLIDENKTNLISKGENKAEEIIEK